MYENTLYSFNFLHIFTIYFPIYSILHKYSTVFQLHKRFHFFLHKVKKQGHWKEGDHAAGGQTACCGAQQKGKAERDQANVDVQPGPQD